MRRLYTREWQGIPFSSFAKTSTSHLADSDFYNSFYRTFFDRYKNYGELDPEWRKTKDELSEWLVNRFASGGKVLSVGCGLGYIEQDMFGKYGDVIELHVQDYAGEAHRWLQGVLPEDRIHRANSHSEDIGQYDLIYLSAVDYALQDKELEELLARLGPALTPAGELIMISSSFVGDSTLGRAWAWCKDAAKALLERLGLYNRGQFWGWMRTRDEYQSVIRSAGYKAVHDGFISTPSQHTYWISGNWSPESDR